MSLCFIFWHLACIRSFIWAVPQHARRRGVGVMEKAEKTIKPAAKLSTHATDRKKPMVYPKNPN